MPRGIADSGDNARQIARKDYVCTACGQPIPKGTPYTRAWGLPFHGENGLIKCSGEGRMINGNKD